MGTTLKGKDIATKKSGHGCVTPPAMSLSPPTPPAGPVPAPFVYVARSATAEDTEAALKASESVCLVERSAMKIDMPGNKPTEAVKPMGGGDIVTHAICGIAVMTDGSAGTSAGGKRVCRTMDNVRMCTITVSQQVAQATVPLLLAGGGAFAGDKGTGTAKKEEAMRTALKEQAAHSGNKTSGPPKPDLESDPVAVATGHVVDEAVDLALPGPIPAVWTRTYTSGRAGERTSLGREGWTHAFEQWVEPGEEVVVHRAAGGREIYFPNLPPDAPAFHRGERLTLVSDRRGGHEIFDHATRRTLSFAPLGDRKRAALRAIRDGHGHTVKLDYDGELLDRITDCAGREIRVRWEARRIVRLEVWARPPEAPDDAPPALLAHVDYTYGPEGELAAATDALGHADRYAYDGHLRLVKKTLKNGFSFHYAFDPDTGRCARAAGDGGLFAARLAIDPAKRTTRVTGTHEPRLYTWDARGVVTRIEAQGAVLEERAFDEDLYLVARVNGAGEAWIAEYDAAGRCTRRVDPAGNATAWVYEGDHLVRRIDPAGHEVQFALDPHGAIVSISVVRGSASAAPGAERGGISIDRDVHGRVTAVHGLRGTIAAFAYDRHGNMIEVTDERGATVRYRFDGLGRAIERADARGAMRVTYDAASRITRLSFANGTERRFEHDAMGNLCREVDRDGRVTEREYTPLGQLAAVTTSDGQRWTFEHDADGRLVEVKNPRCEVYRFEHDRLGRVERELTFDGRALAYRYDKAGRVVRIDFSDGSYREIAYDLLGNVIEVRDPDGVATFARDKLGRIEEAVLEDLGGKHVVRFERDAYGRAVAETQGERTLRFGYDDGGRRAWRVVAGRETKYFHDASGLLAAVEHDGYRVAIERDTFGQEVRRHFYEGRVDVLSAYDGAGRLVARQTTAGEHAEVVGDQRYHYRVSGGPVRADDLRFGATSYRYDARARLLDAAGAPLAEAFAYDAAGALAGAARGAGAPREPEPWGTRAGNVLVRAGGVLYENTERGQRARKIERGEDGDDGAPRVTTYGWDARGQLRDVLLPTGERVVFWYDAFGRRVRKAVYPKESGDFARLVALALTGGEEPLPKPRVTEYLWDGDELAAEIGPEGQRRVYVHEPRTFVPLLHDDDGARFAYVNDPLGVPKALIDEAGRVAYAAAHAAFGDVVATFRAPAAARAADTPFRLLGQVAEAEIGLTMARHRAFDPSTGRWCSPDPLGFAGGEDLYGLNGSPTAVVDPTGLAVCATINRTRDQALADARARAGLAPNAAPEDSFVKRPGMFDDPATGQIGFNDGMSVGDIRSRLGALGPVEVHFNPSDPSGNTVVVIANHSSDPTRPGHVHAGTIPTSDPMGTYTVITPQGGDHHIYYGPVE